MNAAAVAVRDLRYTYPGAEVPAIDGMHFTVGDGEIFGFLGPSGAGKTTTQQVLVGLLRGWTGSAELLGTDVGRWGRRLYDEIGVSFELPTGYPRLTVHEDLAHFAMLHSGPIRDPDELLAAVGLLDSADAPVGALSKGMRVRLNVARALLHRPRLLFLDEPTSGLDPVTARDIRRLIADERERGTTVFVTTHDMVTAELLCDRVAFVVAGRIAACDTPRALKLAMGERSVQVEYRADGRLRTRRFPLGRPDPELAALLTAPGIETVHTDEATLDDVFADVTGRRL